MRVAVYARVSSAGQRDRHTIASQLREVPAALVAMGHAVVEPFYVDDGKAVRLFRAAAAHATAPERRELMRAASERVSVGPSVIAVDLLIDARPVGLGDDACRSVLALPAGRLTVATPRNRTRGPAPRPDRHRAA